MRKGKRFFVGLVTAILALSLLLAACHAPKPEGGVHSINHRGYNSAPENTLAAFRLSAEKGFSMVECDVWFTKDGYPVLLHDGTIDRTSDGSGFIGDLTLEEVRSYDFGSWKSAAYAGEKIPTFEEFIALCKELSLHPYIEIKTGATAERIRGLMDTVARYDMKDRVSWISFEHSFLQTVVETYPGARAGYLVGAVSEEVISRAKQLKTGKNEVFINCQYIYLTEEQVTLCEKARLPLEVWTLNSESEILDAFKNYPYISGVTSDLFHAGSLLAEK